VELDRLVCGEDDLPTAAPGEAGRPRARTSRVPFSSKRGNEEVEDLVGLDAEDGFVDADEVFADHIDGDADGGEAGALALRVCSM